MQSGLADGTSVSVPVRRLDAVWEEAGRPRIGFVKMDVEGAEAAVIRGATGLLGTCHPTMLIEANSAEQLEILRDLLAPFAYQVEQPAGFAPHNFVFYHQMCIRDRLSMCWRRVWPYRCSAWSAQPSACWWRRGSMSSPSIFCLLYTSRCV